MKSFNNYTYDELADLKAKWISNLRSGEYNQGVGQLYHPQRNKFCCLGVFCVTAGLVTNADDLMDKEQNYYDIMKPFMTWYGFNDIRDIWLLNDDTKLDFPAIADILERQRTP